MNQPIAFESTRWSMILAATNANSPDANLALAELCNRYWPPVYAYTLHRVRNAHQAEDLTQGFFQHIFEHDLFGLADKQRGRFRSFLLTSLVNYLNNDWKNQCAEKRGGGRQRIPLEFAFDSVRGGVRGGMQMSNGVTPEQVFERQWALCLLESTLTELGDEMRACGKQELYRQLRPYLTRTGDVATYAQTGALLSMSGDAIKLHVFRLRKRFGQLLRTAIRQTVDSASDVDDEIQRLFSVLSSA